MYGVREHSPDDYAYFPPSGNWYIQMSGDSSYVPMNPSESNNFLSKFTWRLSPRIKISAQSIMSKSQSKSYSHSYKYNPDGVATGYTENNNHSIQINHSLSPKSFYEGNIFVSDTDYKNYLYADTVDRATLTLIILIQNLHQLHFYLVERKWGILIENLNLSVVNLTLPVK